VRPEATGQGVFHVKHPAEEGGVSRETPRQAFDITKIRPRLDVFVALLLRWTERINLIAPGDRDQVWTRHVEDSLQLAPLIPGRPDRAIDLGSGGGFPGLVLAIATGIRFDLVEADQRKAAFLREAARATEAPVTVHAARLEAVALAPARLVTARALAPLPRLLGWAARLLAPGGTLILPKGGDVADELTQAHREWQMRLDRHPSRTDAKASILVISGLNRGRPPG
jgi:16S rRNA (guanine527-N7)-methyltransferase